MSKKDVQKGYDFGYAEGLAHGKLEGADEAENRIIRLLKSKVARHYELHLDASAAYLEQTIALIKGEQK